jgi:hypothetical protein
VRKRGLINRPKPSVRWWLTRRGRDTSLASEFRLGEEQAARMLVVPESSIRRAAGEMREGW